MSNLNKIARYLKNANVISEFVKLIDEKSKLSAKDIDFNEKSKQITKKAIEIKKNLLNEYGAYVRKDFEEFKRFFSSPKEPHKPDYTTYNNIFRYEDKYLEGFTKEITGKTYPGWVYLYNDLATKKYSLSKKDIVDVYKQEIDNVYGNGTWTEISKHKTSSLISGADDSDIGNENEHGELEQNFFGSSKLRATSPTQEGIIKLTSKFFYGSTIRIEQIGDTNEYKVFNAKGLINNYSIVNEKGKWKLIEN